MALGVLDLVKTTCMAPDKPFDYICHLVSLPALSNLNCKYLHPDKIVLLCIWNMNMQLIDNFKEGCMRRGSIGTSPLILLSLYNLRQIVLQARHIPCYLNMISNNCHDTGSIRQSGTHPGGV